ncbi:MAG: heavy metal-binding domain-containing protein [Bacteroidota bacterium]
MKQLIALLAIGALLGLVSACGSGDHQGEEKNGETAMTHQEANGNAHDGESHGGSHMATDETKELPSSDAWAHEGPIDVEALDANDDGYVYQDQMDWNVVADEEGRCPKCGMLLKKVSVAEATENLRKFGFEVVKRSEY